jgi:ubiquinone/menaquinone biosynthesis C-methylase UbiE
MKRVLKTDGQLLHLDFGKNKIPDCVFTFVVWLWAKIFMKNTDAYEYLLNSKEEFLSSVDLIKEFEHNGFRLKKEKKFLFGTIAMQIFTK